MMKLHYKLAIVLILALGSFVKSQENIIIGEKLNIFSKILNEEREIWIHLPKTYGSVDITPAKYPVIYLLDAEINFEYFAPTADYLSRQPYADIPECIVVGIKNTQRTRDLTPTKSSKTDPNNPGRILFGDSGGSNAFLKFIVEELKPYIFKNFRANGFSVLVGHSFGGLFAIDTFLSHPKSFNAYIANDPSLWWDNNLEITRMKNTISVDANFAEKNPIYLSKANNGENKNGFSTGDSDPVLDFEKLLQKSKANFGFGYYENETHGTVSYPANYDGLKFLFKGYRTDIKDIAKNPELLLKSYKNFSDKIGFEFLPSESYIKQIKDFMIKNKFEEGKSKTIDEIAAKLYRK